MIVSYVGNFDAPHSTENHVAKALENLGHQVRRIPEQKLDWPSLPGQVEGSDLFLWTRTAGFDPADLEDQTRALIEVTARMPTAGFHLDRWWGLNREGDIQRSPFFRLDYVFTADGGHDDEWKKAGVFHYWSPPAILSDEAKRVGNYRTDYAADVGFVGNLRNYGHPEWGPYRRKLYKFLAQTYRGRFKLWEGGIRGQDLADLYASVKVLVGDSCLAGNPEKYWSDRIPETLGRGGFLIHPWVKGMQAEYPNLETYELGDFAMLGRMIDFALDHDQYRSNFAVIGRQDVLDRHTYEHRMERVLSTVLG